MTATRKSSHLEVHLILQFPAPNPVTSPASICPATKEDDSASLFYSHSYTLKCTEVEPISMKNALGLNYTLVTSASVVISYIL